MNVAIILARGGSKRIPKKNIKSFHGKPMISYAIKTTIASGCFDKVIVSTDDLEIAKVAESFGADVPFLRPSNISNDFATTAEVMVHACNWCESEGYQVRFYCCIYATAVFMIEEDLRAGKLLLESDDSSDYSFSATSFAFPIQRAIKRNEQGFIEMFTPEYFNSRSQDLEEAYHDAGQFYWGTSDAFKQAKAFFTSNSKVVLLPRIRAVDIDTREDWELAEILYASSKKVKFSSDI